jgi:hypothetical protein
MKKRPAVLTALPCGVASLFLQASPALAQQALVDVLTTLVTNQSIPTGDFGKDAQAALGTRDTIARLLSVELAAQPVTVASPGLIYRLNPELGVVERATDQFGPFYSERALTTGRGQTAFGLTFRHSSYHRLDGHDLRDGQFVTTANQFRDEPQPFDVDRLTLRLDASTVTAFANVGVTDRLDVAVIAPVIALHLEGTRTETYRGALMTQARVNADATGLGDMAVRAKWQVWRGVRAGGLAALGEIRFPTGDTQNLLGAGKTSLRLLAIASTGTGRVGVDFNGGFTSGGLADELHYTLATSLAASPRITLVGELLGHRLTGVGQITSAEAPHPTIQGVDTLRLTTTDASTMLASALAGVKWNVAGMWLVSGSVAWPLTNNGLRPGPVAQVGLEYVLTH